MPSEMSTACADQNRGRTVEALERELNETHRRGIATAEVLRIIGNSPTNAQPVFDTIAASATRLCGGLYGVVFRFDGEMITVAADSAESSRASAIIRSAYPAAPGRGTMASRALLERRVIALTDAQDSVENPAGAERARAIGYRAGLSVPMLRGDMAIGAINIVRRDAIPFSENEVELLKTFADQAVIAIENTRLFEEVQARNRELRATLEQQTATSDILGVISRSVTGVQPVFDAIAESAAKLCAADFSVVARFDGEVIHLAALVLQSEQQRTAIEKLYPRKPDRATQVARAILTRRTQHVPDTTRDPAYADAPNTGFHSALAVPMLREGLPIGAVSVGRTRIGGFSDGQIELLKTFADQAVIAIENARLFEAEQASKRDLQESLEYQTATSEVLNVISRSPTELQPVLDAIAATAARLCESMDATVWRVAGGRARRVAQFGSPTSSSALPLTRGSVTGRAIVDRKTIHVHDLAAMVETEYPDVKEVQQRIGHRTTLATPLLSQGEALGAISARKNHVHPFSDRQIALLQTFADQAVIAIENARLFEEVQARTRDLTEALEQQTATSEVLEVISRSPSDLGPVLDTIVKTAARLCQAESAFIWKLEGNHFCLAAMNDIEAELAKFALQHPPPLDRKTTAGRCVLERRTIHIRDALEDSEYVWRGDEEKRIARGYRTLLGIPLLGRGEPFGAFVLIRRDVKPFTNRQIKLGVTFADQAVIAIENTRLFEEVQTRTKELQESLEYQTATSDVLGVISRSKFDLQPVLDSIVETAARLCACDMATIRGREGDVYVQLGGYGLPAEYADYSRSTNWHHAGRGSLVGRVLQEGKAVQIVDVLADPEYSLDEAQRRGGFRTMLGVPLLRGDEQLGIIVLMRRAVRPFDNRQIELVAAFADQAVIAIENTRLFEEVQARTRELATTIQELEIASQHKSQFVANMSHELRTPLAAVLGYAELLQEGIYGALPEKSLPILTRIRSNGQHLLGLINTVLDISKIEAGQFKLNVGEYALGNIVETVMVATESLAATKKLAFNMDVAKGLPYGLGDEQRLTQVLLNLVGNAIKFTDAGEVRITAGSANGYFELSVSDTGPGIPPGERERIFEKFGQVDSSNTRAKGGTGLGLAIARDIVEMHGGRIWVESKLGQGSTFRMKLPVRAAVAGSAA